MLPEFYLFGFELHSYPVIATVAAITGFIVVWIQSRKLGYSFAFSTVVVLAVIVGFFLGARLLNIAVNFSYYQVNPNALFEFSFKGFSVVGGVFLTGVFLVAAHKIAKKEILGFFDSISIPFLTLFSLMKFGCFLNGCCSGMATSSCFGIVFPAKESVSNPFRILSFLSSFVFGAKKVLPTQLFESILALLIAVFVLFFRKKYLAKKGDVFAFSMLLFFAVRLSMHFFRDFNYSPVILYFVYPLIYGVFITLSVLWLCRREFVERLLGFMIHSKE